MDGSRSKVRPSTSMDEQLLSTSTEASSYFYLLPSTFSIDVDLLPACFRSRPAYIEARNKFRVLSSNE